VSSAQVCLAVLVDIRTMGPVSPWQLGFENDTRCPAKDKNSETPLHIDSVRRLGTGKPAAWFVHTFESRKRMRNFETNH